MRHRAHRVCHMHIFTLVVPHHMQMVVFAAAGAESVVHVLNSISENVVEATLQQPTLEMYITRFRVPHLPQCQNLMSLSQARRAWGTC